jgi:FkbM family methyltransferase
MQMELSQRLSNHVEVNASMPSEDQAIADAMFWRDLLAEILACSYRYERSNLDRERFPQSRRESIKEWVVALAASCGFHRQPHYEMLPDIPGFGTSYSLFNDHHSRSLFIKLLAYRILGRRCVRLPMNTENYWKLRDSVSGFIEESGVLDAQMLTSLDLFKIEDMRFWATRLAVANTFLVEQYRCPRADVGVRPGDVVLDGGGCYGDTALYFARNGGRVYCWECMPKNVEVFKRNCDLNPRLSGNITLIPKAMWSVSEETLVFSDFGSGSQAGGAQPADGVAVQTLSIDDFAAGLDRVDFIKLDLEGAEPEALAGAEKTIRKHRPQLALSVYHYPAHFAEIPNWINGLGLGYKFWLDHFTVHHEETILFARC